MFTIKLLYAVSTEYSCRRSSSTSGPSRRFSDPGGALA